MEECRSRWSLSLHASLQRRSAAAERLRSLGCRLRAAGALHGSLQGLNVLNDAFFVWHCGKFATVNGFRLGRLTACAVDWPEVNAALGASALLLATIGDNPRNDLVFSQYRIVPMGSFTKIAK